MHVCRHRQLSMPILDAVRHYVSVVLAGMPLRAQVGGGRAGVARSRLQKAWQAAPTTGLTSIGNIGENKQRRGGSGPRARHLGATLSRGGEGEQLLSASAQQWPHCKHGTSWQARAPPNQRWWRPSCCSRGSVADAGVKQQENPRSAAQRRARAPPSAAVHAWRSTSCSCRSAALPLARAGPAHYSLTAAPGH
jgi:hypothetical protein